MRSTTLALAALALAACGIRAGGMNDAGGSGPTPAEEQAFDRGGRTQSSDQQAIAVANAVFDLETTIKPGDSAAQNAQSAEAHATASLKGCGKVTLSGTTLTVDFGPPPGCTLPDGSQASGSVTVSVTTPKPMEVALALTFGNLVVNGKDLAGTATFSTTSGSSFRMTASLTSAGSSLDADVSVTAASGTVTIAGTSTSKSGPTTTTVELQGLSWKIGECYPRGGSIRITQALVRLTVTFSATTPLDGKVMVTSGVWTTSMTLPPYGKCPPPADGGA